MVNCVGHFGQCVVLWSVQRPGHSPKRGEQVFVPSLCQNLAEYISALDHPIGGSYEMLTAACVHSKPHSFTKPIVEFACDVRSFVWSIQDALAELSNGL